MTQPGVPLRYTARVPHTARVVRAGQVTPLMRRVTIAGEGLDAFAGADPAAKITIYLPDGDGAITSAGRRSWTARAARAGGPDGPEVDLDFADHPGGEASVWAATAAPGDPLGWAGPAAGYVPMPSSDVHVLVADATGLPAVSSVLEALPDGARALALLEVRDAAERQEIVTRADARVDWLLRGSAAPSESLLPQAFSTLSWPGGQVQVMVVGEAGIVREVVVLLRPYNIPPMLVHAKGYWRAGRSKQVSRDVTDG